MSSLNASRVLNFPLEPFDIPALNVIVMYFDLLRNILIVLR